MLSATRPNNWPSKESLDEFAQPTRVQPDPNKMWESVDRTNEAIEEQAAVPEPTSAFQQFVDVGKRVVTETVRMAWDTQHFLNAQAPEIPGLPGMVQVDEGIQGAQLVEAPAYTRPGSPMAPPVTTPARQLWAMPKDQAIVWNTAQTSQLHDATQKTLVDWGVAKDPKDIKSFSQRVAEAPTLPGKAFNTTMWLVEETAGMTPALGAAIAATVATGPIGGVLVGGIMEAGAEVQTMVDAGMGADEIAMKTAGIGAFIGALNMIPLGGAGAKLLARYAKSPLGYKIASKALTAGEEAFTEWLEGPAIGGIEGIGTDEGVLKGMADGALQELDVVAPAGLSSLLIPGSGRGAARTMRRITQEQARKTAAEFGAKNGTIPERTVDADIDALLEVVGDDQVTTADAMSWGNAIGNGRGETLIRVRQEEKRKMKDAPKEERDAYVQMRADMAMAQFDAKDKENAAYNLWKDLQREHDMLVEDVQSPAQAAMDVPADQREAFEAERAARPNTGRTVEDVAHLMDVLDLQYGFATVTEVEAQTGHAPKPVTEEQITKPVVQGNLTQQVLGMLSADEQIRFHLEQADKKLPELSGTPEEAVAMLRQIWTPPTTSRTTTTINGQTVVTEGQAAPTAEMVAEAEAQAAAVVGPSILNVPAAPTAEAQASAEFDAMQNLPEDVVEDSPEIAAEAEALNIVAKDGMPERPMMSKDEIWNLYDTDPDRLRTLVHPEIFNAMVDVDTQVGDDSPLAAFKKAKGVNRTSPDNLWHMARKRVQEAEHAVNGDITVGDVLTAGRTQREQEQQQEAGTIDVGATPVETVQALPAPTMYSFNDILTNSEDKEFQTERQLRESMNSDEERAARAASDEEIEASSPEEALVMAKALLNQRKMWTLPQLWAHLDGPARGEGAKLTAEDKASSRDAGVGAGVVKHYATVPAKGGRTRRTYYVEAPTVEAAVAKLHNAIRKTNQEPEKPAGAQTLPAQKRSPLTRLQQHVEARPSIPLESFGETERAEIAELDTAVKKANASLAEGARLLQSVLNTDGSTSPEGLAKAIVTEGIKLKGGSALDIPGLLEGAMVGVYEYDPARAKKGLKASVRSIAAGHVKNARKVSKSQELARQVEVQADMNVQQNAAQPEEAEEADARAAVMEDAPPESTEAVAETYEDEETEARRKSRTAATIIRERMETGAKPRATKAQKEMYAASMQFRELAVKLNAGEELSPNDKAFHDAYVAELMNATDVRIAEMDTAPQRQNPHAAAAKATREEAKREVAANPEAATEDEVVQRIEKQNEKLRAQKTQELVALARLRRILDTAQKVVLKRTVAYEGRMMTAGQMVLEGVSDTRRSLAHIGELSEETKKQLEEMEYEAYGLQLMEDTVVTMQRGAGKKVNTNTTFIEEFAKRMGYTVVYHEGPLEATEDMKRRAGIPVNDVAYCAGTIDSGTKTITIGQAPDKGLSRAHRQQAQTWHLTHELGHLVLESLAAQTNDSALAALARALIQKHTHEGAADLFADTFFFGSEDIAQQRSAGIFGSAVSAFLNMLPESLQNKVAGGLTKVSPRYAMKIMFGDKWMERAVAAGTGAPTELASVTRKAEAQQEQFEREAGVTDGVFGIMPSLLRTAKGVTFNEWHTPADSDLVRRARESGIPVNAVYSGGDLYKAVALHYGTAEAAAAWFTAHGVDGQLYRSGKNTHKVIGNYAALEVPDLETNKALTPAQWVGRQVAKGRTYEEVRQEIRGNSLELDLVSAMEAKRLGVMRDAAQGLRNLGADGMYAFARAKQLTLEDWKVTPERLQEAMVGYNRTKVRTANVVQAELQQVEQMIHSDQTPENDKALLVKLRASLHSEMQDLGEVPAGIPGAQRFTFMNHSRPAYRWAARAFTIRQYGEEIGCPKLGNALWRAGGVREEHYNEMQRTLKDVSDRAHKVFKDWRVAQTFLQHITLRAERDNRYMSGVGQAYYESLTPAQQTAMDECVQIVRSYYDTVQQRLKARGFNVDFVQHRYASRQSKLKTVQKEIDDASAVFVKAAAAVERAASPSVAQENAKVKAAKTLSALVEKRQQYLTELSVLAGLQYMNIPVKQLDKRKQGARMSTMEERSALSLWSLISGEESSLRLRDVNIVDVMGEYGEHLALDMALGECLQAAREDGVVTYPTKDEVVPGYEALDSSHPLYSGVWMRQDAKDFLYNNTLRGYMNGPVMKNYRRLAVYRKSVAFWNFIVMPMLNSLQHVGLMVNPLNIHAMHRLSKEKEENSPQYVEYLRSGAASNPHGAPLSTNADYQRLKRGGGAWMNFLRSAGFANGRLEMRQQDTDKWKTLGRFFGDNVVTAYYDVAQSITWHLDDVQRFYAYTVLRKRGLSMQEAGLAVADAMGDYGNIPKATRIYLSNVFFTPSYMQSTLMHAAGVARHSAVGLRAYATGQPVEAKHKVAMRAAGAYLMTQLAIEAVMRGLGFGWDDGEDTWTDMIPGRRYSKRVYSEALGREQEVVTQITTPMLVPLRELQRLEKLIRTGTGLQSILHPALTVPYYAFAHWTSPWGEPITEKQDPTYKQAVQASLYVLKQLVPVLDIAVSSQPVDHTLEERLGGASGIFNATLGYFATTYTRETPERRAYIKAQREIKNFKSAVFRRLGNADAVPEDWYPVLESRVLELMQD